MKKILLIIFFLPITLLGNNNLIYKWGLNVGFNAFMLLGNTDAVVSQFTSADNQYGGGGLRYIEPGFELSTTLFLDTAMKHRIVAGGEFIFMHAKEIQSNKSAINSYFYKYHKVQLGDIFAGYQYAFYEAPFQEVRIFAGAEVMLNNIFTNELNDGEKQIASTTFIIADTTYSSDAQIRLGGRIRVGFEGRLYNNIYITTGFTCGIYNLLLNKNEGELFKSPNTLNFSNKEVYQTFFNYILSFQYRFNRHSATN